MFVVFRTDANPVIGTGHAMRCLALAEALASGGARCLFLCRGEGLGNLAQRIVQAGHELSLLPEGPAENPPAPLPRHAPWLPHGWRHDADLCRRELASCPPPDWIVVDHYALDAHWERSLRLAADKLMAIDDLADRDHDCDLLLDQGDYPDAAQRYSCRIPGHCTLLLGPHHALLRPQFAAARPGALQRPVADHAGRLLVMFGGADADDLTGRTVDAIAHTGLAAQVEVVAGPLYAHRDTLEKRLAALPAATLHTAPDRIADLMAASDLAIGSPGTTSWERCALGLPAIAIAVADNQEAMAEQLGRRGAHLYLGRQEALADADLAAAIRLLAANAPWRGTMRQQAAAVTDGLGAARVARRLAGPAIELRRAEDRDSRLLYGWRNDLRVRRHAFDPSPISWESHHSWFAAALADPGRALLIGRVDGRDAGCVRFDLRDGRARISIYLDPERLGEGLSVPILQAADAWLATEYPGISAIVAEVMADNEASRRAFQGAGYRLEHSIFVKRLGAAAAPSR